MGLGFKNILRVLIIGALFLSTLQVANAASSSDKFEKYKLVKSAFACNISMETMAKSYLYLGEGTGTRQARDEMKKAIAKFDKNFKLLNASTNDKKVKNLLLFNEMNYDELIDLIKQPYNLDNAQKVMDLVAAVSEGSRHIAEVYKKEIGHKDKVDSSGLRPVIESIAKYYIAYQAGIKDENTVQQMKKAVAFCDKGMKIRVNYPKNTVKMNQIINKLEKLWGIVNQFYLDIDEGGLPFIVFKTTKELKDGIKAYSQEYNAIKKSQLEVGKKK